MAGVSSLVDNNETSATLASGATSVALWNNGAEAVAYKGRAVAVNASVDGSAMWSGDFARLTLNAVTWLGRHDLTVGKSRLGLRHGNEQRGGYLVWRHLRCAVQLRQHRHVDRVASERFDVRGLERGGL